MKIFVTGCKGFVGHYLEIECKKRNIEFYGVDIFKEVSVTNTYNCCNIGNKLIAKYIPDNCDAVVHLAAISNDKSCESDLRKCYETNIIGTINLLEAARQKKVKNFIFASTEWVYDSFKDKETKTEKSFIDVTKLTSNYAMSKLLCENILRSRYIGWSLNMTILRFGIIYGARKSGSSAVESIFNQVKKQDKVEVDSLGTGRCFVHVRDIVDGIIKSIPLQNFNIINLEYDKLITLKDIITTSEKILNKKVKIIERNKKNKNIRIVSNNKAKKLLKWKPNYDIEKGLQTLNHNTKSYYCLYADRETNLCAIDDYNECDGCNLNKMKGTKAILANLSH